MKKLLALLMVLTLLVGMSVCTTSCGGETAEEELFKVGAIYITSKNDTAGYTYAHHTGIVNAMKALGMDVDKQLLIVDNVSDQDPEATKAAIDTLAGKGANIIIGISYGYMEPMAEKAEQYTDIVFSHGTGYMANETNFNNYFGRIYQARYLAGVAAGLKSKETGNNNVGYVAAFGKTLAETGSGINSFTLGVQAANPDAKVYVKLLNNWADEKNEAAFAAELISSYKCGVISQHCDSAQPQIAAQNAGVFGCGYNSDMTDAAPDAHLTAAVWNWDVYYQVAIKAAMDCGEAKNFVNTIEGGQAYYGGLKEGFVAVSALSKNCAPNTQKAIDAISEMIVNGEWDVFSGYKLSVDADGNVTKTAADLIDDAGNVIVAAGGASVEDGVIKGSMDYYVAGVSEV